MKSIVAAVLLCALSMLPLMASADTSTPVNRVIVNQALQDQLQNQLNVQQAQLQTRQALLRAGLQNDVLQQQIELRYLLLQQQLELIKLEQREQLRSSRSHHQHHHS
jgi:hypothetical protein